MLQRLAEERDRSRHLPQQVNQDKKIIPGRCYMIHPPGMIRIKRSKDGKLTAEVGLLYLVAGHQLGAGAGKDDAAGFQDIGPVGDL